MFGQLKEIFWLSKIILWQDRDQNISSCFNLKVDFKYPQTLDKFNMKKKTDNDSVVNNVMGEKNIFNKVIVIDDVSGLAGRSNGFANFSIVAQKFNFTCVFVFQMIISQTKIFNIFPGSLQTTSVAKILSSYCNRCTYKYIPHSILWINRLFFKMPSSISLTTDTRDVNNLGPSNFRTGAKNSHEKVKIISKLIKFLIYFYPSEKQHLSMRYFFSL